jgi:hypothetical protein
MSILDDMQEKNNEHIDERGNTNSALNTRITVCQNNTNFYLKNIISLHDSIILQHNERIFRDAVESIISGTVTPGTAEDDTL